MTALRGLAASCVLAALLHPPPAAAHPAAGRAGQVPSGPSPDALYAERDQPGRARAAARQWQASLDADPSDFEAAWKLARALYWLGTQEGDTDTRRKDLESGVAAGRAAARLRDDRPEGHFWMAANMGALAQSFGMRQGLRYRGAIKDALERVLAIDPGFQDGSADRALGRWYFKVPGLFGGSNDKAVAHLERSLTYDPDSTASLLFLAEVHLDEGRKDEARRLLRQVLDAPVHPGWGPEDRVFKAQARELLAKIGG